MNGDVVIDVGPSGRVFANGRHVLTIDASGRVYDAYHAPVALLQRDGLVFGTDDTPLGWVGAGEAIRPGEEHSWLVLHPSGLVLRSDGDEQKPFGQWLGCQHPTVLQVCTLVSHVLGPNLLSRAGGGAGLGLAPGLGLGIGAGMFGP